MHIDVVLNPAEIALLPQRDLTSTTCIVFDVLRATSSMVTGLAHGAEEIHPACTIEEALAMRERMPDAILGGERHGNPIPGFDIGNSPMEYGTAVSGRRIVTTTTNGTVALRACEQAKAVLVGALLNIEALVAAIRAGATDQLLLICAGTFETFALEDAYAAGILIRALESATLTDSAQTVRTLAQAYPDPLGALQLARNGQALAANGRGPDVEWCAQVSKYNVVGHMTAGVIRRMNG